ncbi:unnamed protein product, partial [Meganyctiphanes norvegica]
MTVLLSTIIFPRSFVVKSCLRVSPIEALRSPISCSKKAKGYNSKIIFIAHMNTKLYTLYFNKRPYDNFAIMTILVNILDTDELTSVPKSHPYKIMLSFSLTKSYVNEILLVYTNMNILFNKPIPKKYTLLYFGKLCMLLSSLYHTFNCLSEDVSCKWLSWDLFGIATSFSAIFLSGIYYGFWCNQFLHLRYIYSGLVCGLFVAAMIFLLVPRLMTREWDFARMWIFICWSASGLLPTIHWTILHWGSSKAIVKVFLPRIFAMYGISGVALLVYIYKIPERFRPGRFDFIGASHQLWHIIMVVALVYWHQTGLEYAKYRSYFTCESL